jgi:hypothetical protein
MVGEPVQDETFTNPSDSDVPAPHFDEYWQTASNLDQVIELTNNLRYIA